MRKNKNKIRAWNALLVWSVLILWGWSYGLTMGTRQERLPMADNRVPETYREGFVRSIGIRIQPVSAAEVETREANRTGMPTQEQKNIAATTCLRHFDGEDASKCYVRILAMTKHESGFNCSLVGDTNLKSPAWGCLQIRGGIHGVSKEQAEDYAFATEWTIQRMLRYGYKNGDAGISAAIAAHNGAGEKARNYARNVRATAKQYEESGI